MKYLSNAFSLNMIPEYDYSLIRIRKVSPSDIPDGVISVIGHKDTATVVSGILGFETPFNRVNLVLDSDDILYVAQYKGPRLPEGATQLPEGATIEFQEIILLPGWCK